MSVQILAVTEMNVLCLVQLVRVSLQLLNFQVQQFNTCVTDSFFLIVQTVTCNIHLISTCFIQEKGFILSFTITLMHYFKIYLAKVKQNFHYWSQILAQCKMLHILIQNVNTQAPARKFDTGTELSLSLSSFIIIFGLAINS